MKQIPILFSTQMVQAILDGRKTQTRRVVKGVDNHYYQSLVNHATGKHTFVMNGIYDPQESDVCEIKCPYGQPGDVLWVRETVNVGMNGKYHYKTDELGPLNEVKWKPSIHMPKAACRLFLKVKSVRVERLQDISEEDAIAEGIKMTQYPPFKENRYYDYQSGDMNFWRKPIKSFMSLWVSINGPESWDANPWVWVVEFERTERPEDFLTRQPKQKKCVSLG